MRTLQDEGERPTRTSTTNNGDTREGKQSGEKVENIHRGSVTALEGEYYTHPVSQMRNEHPYEVKCSSKSTYIFRTGTSTQYWRVN